MGGGSELQVSSVEVMSRQHEQRVEREWVTSEQSEGGELKR